MENNTEMKPMVYTNQQLYDCLYEGFYKDYHFVIMSLGSHPCAYVEIPESHKYYVKKHNDMDIYCHGGLTFSNHGLGTIHSDFYRTGFWIGWDYGHYCDYSGYKSNFPFNGKKWTTWEIYEEIKDVIDQLAISD